MMEYSVEELNHSINSETIVLPPSPSFESPSRNSLQQELHTLETEYSSLFRVLEQKKAKITFLRRHLSPIRQIPPETLSDIFIHCLPADFVFRLPSHPPAMFNVLGVCRQWRNIAHATPQLWSQMDIDCDSYNFKEDWMGKSRTTMAAWIKHATLDLRIKWNNFLPYVKSRESDSDSDSEQSSSEDEYSECPDVLLGELISTSSRWRSLQFHSLREQFTILWSSGASMNKLHSLDLRLYNIPDTALGIMEFPQLRKLTVRTGFLAELVKAPLLNELNLACIGSSNWDCITSALPLLQTLEFHEFFETRGHVENNKTHTLINLTNLKIRPNDPSEWGFPCYLKMPSLKCLKFESCVLPALDAFDYRSITDLALEDVKQSNMKPCLLHLDSLRRITLAYCVRCEILEMLADESICPLLSSLTMIATALKQEDLLKFLELRAPAYSDDVNSIYQRRHRDGMKVPCLVTIVRCTTGTERQVLADVKDADYISLRLALQH